jgi:uncharacterized repeat protein (TIGR03803 family)
MHSLASCRCVTRNFQFRGAQLQSRRNAAADTTNTEPYSSLRGSGDGEEPYAGLINVKGTLYGTTSIAGANGDGTVFWLSP